MAETRAYIFHHQRDHGYFNLPHLGITAPLEALPYIHALPSSGLEDRISIEEREEPQGEKKVVEYRYTATSNEKFNYFIAAMTEAIAFYSLLNPRSPRALDSLSELDHKIDRFLFQHAGTNYQQLTQNISFKELTREDFSLVAPKLRRKLFDFRAKVYLAALAAAADQEIELPALLEQVYLTSIIPLKRQQDEPVFSYLMTCLRKNVSDAA